MQKSPGAEGAEQKEIGGWADFTAHLYFFPHKSAHSQTTDELAKVSMRKKREKRQEKESLPGDPSWERNSEPQGPGKQGRPSKAGQEEGLV